jgi:hypothetical protein
MVEDHMAKHAISLIEKSAMLVALIAGISINGDASAQTYTACPTTGITASQGTVNLQNGCEIDGNVVLGGSAALVENGGTLTIKGNVTLGNGAVFYVINSNLVFPQTNYNQYQITLNGNSQFVLIGSTLATNGTSQNNFAMTLQANEFSTVEFGESQLDTGNGSWLLGNFNNNSTLLVANSQNLPTEVYPSDASNVTITSGSGIAGVWLNFPPGSNGTVNIPTLDQYGNYSFAFGPTTGIAYSVTIIDSRGRIGINSYPGSTAIVNGYGSTGATNQAGVVFGYYIENNTSPVNINDLNVGNNISEAFTDQGRLLKLNHVNLNPFSWQVYVSQSNGYPVYVVNSVINEIAAMTNGLVNISNSILQLGVVGAEGPGSVMNISNSQIWSQAIQAAHGGKLTASDSQIFGNFITASGTGSKIIMTNVTANRNALPPQSCTAVGGYPPNNAGVPLCNPFNPLYQCPQLMPATDGAAIASDPALDCPPI